MYKRVLILIILSILGIYNPIFTLGILAVLFLFLATIVYWKNINIDFIFFLLSLVTAFWGPYLSIPGISFLFMFRIILPVHLTIFFIRKKSHFHLEKFKLVTLGLLIWFVISVISLLWSKYPRDGILSLYFEFEIVYFIFFSIYYLVSLKRIKITSGVLALNYMLIIGYSSIFEFFLESHLKFSTAAQSTFDTRPTGMFVNTNDFSVFISMYLLFYLIAIGKTNLYIGVRYFSALFMILVAGFLIIQTESRTGALAFISVLLLVGIKFLKTKLLLILSALASIWMTFKYVSFNSHSSVGALFQVQNFFSGKVNSNHERVKIYLYALKMVRDHPWGMGIGSSERYVFYLLNGFIGLPDVKSQSMGMHNFILSLLFDIGFIGLTGFLIVLMYWGYKSVSLYVRSKSLVFFYPLASLTCFVAVSVGSSSIFEMRTVWISVGVALAIIINEKYITMEIM